MFQRLYDWARTRGDMFWIVTGLVLQPLLVMLYLGSETAIPFWDYAMYADRARDLFQSADLNEALQKLSESLAQNYNLVFALPALPFFALFGSSRFVFIVAQALIVLPLYQAAFAFVLKQLTRCSFKRALAQTLGLCALIPFLWFPLLEGYPDHGAAAFLLLALGLVVSREKKMASAFAVGLALALAILLRRHYAYAGLALLTAGLLCDGVRLRNVKPLGYYLCAGLTVLAGLLAFEPVYLQTMLQTNFTALYSSYDRGAGYFSLFALGRVGVDLVLIAAAGWFFLLKETKEARGPYLLPLVFVGVWFLFWALGPAQAADHYLLSVLPVFILIGLSGLMVGRMSRKVRIGLFCFLALRSVFALGLGPQGPLPSAEPSLMPTYFARPPVRDPDEQQLIGLGQNLILTNISASDRILIVGSSFLLNQDKMRVLLSEKLRSPETASKILPAPEIDGKDQTPVDVFGSATVYVVPRNAQYHLDPSGQKVVTALWSALIKMREESVFFERLQNKYQIGDQTVEIWRRKSWTPDKLLRGAYLIGGDLQYMRPWMATRWGNGVQITQNLQDSQILARAGSVENAVSAFLIVPLEAGRYVVSGTLSKEEGCGPAYLKARVDTMLGQTLTETTQSTTVARSAFEIPLSIPDKETGFLSLDLWGGQAVTCLYSIDALRVDRR